MIKLFLFNAALVASACALHCQTRYCSSYMVVAIDTCQSIITVDRPIHDWENNAQMLFLHASKSRSQNENTAIGDLVLCRIDSVHQGKVFLNNDLTSLTQDANCLQAVVPMGGTDLQAGDTIKCAQWNSRFGGVIILRDSILDLRSIVIDASHAGFCGGFQMFSDTTTSGRYLGSRISVHGETFLSHETTYAGLAGVSRNGGGSGGSGMMKGGAGGASTTAFEHIHDGTQAGSQYLQPRMVFGSGGGSGHTNDLGRSYGGRGGGIVVVIADSLITDATTTIIASGQDAISVYADGAGGGGAGGCVAISSTGTRIKATINVAGGHGGPVESNTLLSGPGGGGAGGIVLIASGTTFTQPPYIRGGEAGEIIQGGTAVGQRGNLSGGVGTILTRERLYRQLPSRKASRFTLIAGDSIVEYGQSTTIRAFGDGTVRWLSQGLKGATYNSRDVETQPITGPQWFAAEFVSAAGCITRDSVRIRPRIEAQTLLVEADFLRAHPGDTVDLFLRAELTAAYKRDLVGTIHVSTYSAMLHPLRSHRLQNVRSHVRIPFSISAGSLSTFRREAAIVMLADSVATQIAIDSVTITNASVSIRRKHGRVTLDSVCVAGGNPRLFNPHTSPFSILGRVITATANAIFVSDVLGRDIGATISLQSGTATVTIPEHVRGLVLITCSQGDRVYHRTLYY